MKRFGKVPARNGLASSSKSVTRASRDWPPARVSSSSVVFSTDAGNANPCLVQESGFPARSALRDSCVHGYRNKSSLYIGSHHNPDEHWKETRSTAGIRVSDVNNREYPDWVEAAIALGPDTT